MRYFANMSIIFETPQASRYVIAFANTFTHMFSIAGFAAYSYQERDGTAFGQNITEP